ncbi:MAG: HAMP domain-containing sensor histidine kinase [Campylobacterota bacterium]|nr:HAMP domain-containing sensor histidine kinase [Campylobacterota bacterium]
MLKHEKKAFWKFFIIYFGSVALLILASGFFYFEEQKKTLIEKEHFLMIEYVRQIKMKKIPQTTTISYEIKDIVIEEFSMDNFKIQEDKFLKYMPYSWQGGYILVQKDKSEYYKNLLDIKLHIIALQIFLLILFGVISYFLSVGALRPMQEAITKLDNFSKDLIHDLNTPITSILLNIKLLSKKSEFIENKPLIRIKKSVEDISELHNNLTLLLQEKTMIIQNENLFEIVNDVVQTQQRIYTEINFLVELNDFSVLINKNAFKQILVNLVSNACKYNKENGFIKIYTRNNILYIQDSGVGIKNPNEIFERSYKEHSSGYGIGLDITKRLCDAMEIKIDVKSELNKGSEFSLIFKQNYVKI